MSKRVVNLVSLFTGMPSGTRRWVWFWQEKSYSELGWEPREQTPLGRWMYLPYRQDAGHAL